MPDVEYHGWTHRPKSQGGTDPIEIAASAIPTVVCRASAQDLVDGASNCLGALTGASFPSGLTGVADRIIVYNDPGDGTGVFNIFDGETVQVCNGAYLMGFEAGVELVDDFTGSAQIAMSDDILLTVGFASGNSKLYNIVYDSSDPYALRVAGQITVNAPTFDPDTWNGNMGSFVANVLTDAVVDQGISHGWMVISCLSTLEQTGFFQP